MIYYSYKLFIIVVIQELIILIYISSMDPPIYLYIFIICNKCTEIK